MPSGVRAVACGQADMTMVIVAFILLCFGRPIVIHISPSKKIIQLLKNIFASHFTVMCFEFLYFLMT